VPRQTTRGRTDHVVTEVPVVIAGGGDCPLTSSISPFSMGAEQLVERQPSTSRLPNEHYLNQPTIEMVRRRGCADVIDQVGAAIDGGVRPQQCQIGDHGSGHLRPDNHVALRSAGAVGDRADMPTAATERVAP
jgi:hypothetical protein